MLYVPSLLPFVVISLGTFLLFQSDKQVVASVWQTVIRQMKNPTYALLGALVFVTLMMMGGNYSAVNHVGQVLMIFQAIIGRCLLHFRHNRFVFGFSNDF